MNENTTKVNGSMSSSENQTHYWQTLEEKNSPPIAKWLLPEFHGSIEELKEEAKKRGYSRKNFIKLMGAATVMAGAACRRPTEEIVPAVIQPTEYVPGQPSFYSTTSPDGTGMVVRTREGRPIKLAGSIDHPLTRGGVSSSNVASIMDLYDPDRCRHPVKISNGKGKKASESDIVDDASFALEDGDYVLLTGPINSPTGKLLISKFLDKYPGGRHIEYRQDPSLRQIAAGQKASYGTELVPNYRFDKAEVILAIENDFMGSMPGATYFTASWGKKKDITRSKNINKLMVLESMFTLTGSNADERHPIRPGDVTAVALGIASALVGKSSYAGNAQVTSLLAKNTPASVEKTTGVPAATLEKMADELWKKRGKGLVIGGSSLAANGNEVSLQVVINLINAMLGNDGVTIDYANPMKLSTGASDAEIAKLVSDMKAGNVKTLVVAGANPAYHLPKSLEFEEAIQKVEYVLSLNDRIDETGKLATALLPSSHYLESWGDSEMISGVYGVQQPVIRPLYETRSFEDRLIQLAGGSLAGYDSFHTFLKDRWKTIQITSGNTASFEKFWVSALQAGYFSVNQASRNAIQSARNFNAGSLSQVAGVKPAAGMKVGFYYNIQVLDGDLANNAYRQELPEPITKSVWQNHISMLPATARKMGIKQGTIVKVKTENGDVRLPVYLTPGIHPDAILIALGYGRTAAGRVGNNLGVSLMEITPVNGKGIIYSGIKAEIEKTGKRHKIATTQNVYRYNFNTEDRAFFAPGSMPNAPMGGSSQYDRPIIMETNLKEFKKDPNTFYPPEIEYPENAAIMTGWEYTGMKWGMTVDLNLCNGCSACVTSCNLENNIPMVGPDEVYISREMHWLRIDRYFSGSEENPDVSHQPMTCQHCENAPCENVCPVAATQHNSEGLNVMAYNRCIGTRYCANNCPYKVRRFNWFENWYKMEGWWRRVEDPQHLGFNPDVAVRSRGVIEKCSFCIHRINQARAEMRASGKQMVEDGVVVTACEEVCPTRAIQFGNVNDPESRVAKTNKNDTRGYRVLEFLNVKPSITYLAKIRNNDKSYQKYKNS